MGQGFCMRKLQIFSFLVLIINTGCKVPYSKLNINVTGHFYKDLHIYDQSQANKMPFEVLLNPTRGDYFDGDIVPANASDSEMGVCAVYRADNCNGEAWNFYCTKVNVNPFAEFKLTLEAETAQYDCYSSVKINELHIIGFRANQNYPNLSAQFTNFPSSDFYNITNYIYKVDTTNNSAVKLKGIENLTWFASLFDNGNADDKVFYSNYLVTNTCKAKGNIISSQDEHCDLNADINLFQNVYIH